MSGKSIADQLIEQGITTQQEHETRERKLRKKNDGAKYYERRHQRKQELLSYPMNRLKTEVAYGKWLVDETVKEHVACDCCFCGQELGEEFIDLAFDGKRHKIALIINEKTYIFEQELEMFISCINPGHYRRSLKSLEILPNARGRYKNKYIEGYICFECLKFYILKKFYPSHTHRKKQQNVQSKKSKNK